MPTYQYTSASRLRTRVSTTGVTLRTDDITVAHGASLVGDVIDRASDDVEGFVYFGYELAQLEINAWLNQRCTDIAVYYLCERRLNAIPKPVERAFDRANADLEKVRLGMMQIPGAARRKGAAPAMSNLRVAMRPFNHVVVERMRSQTAGAEQHDGTNPNYDWTEWFEYGGR